MSDGQGNYVKRRLAEVTFEGPILAAFADKRMTATSHGSAWITEGVENISTPTVGQPMRVRLHQFIGEAPVWMLPLNVDGEALVREFETPRVLEFRTREIFLDGTVVDAFSGEEEDQ